MNELLAVIYISFWEEDDHPDKLKYHEAETYWCFTHLMSEVRDTFSRNLDTEVSGIKGQIAYFSAMLSHVDSELYQHMDELGVNP